MQHTNQKLSAEAMIAPDGSLVLLSPAVLPYKPGTYLRVQISVAEEQVAEAPIRRTIPLMRYEELIGVLPPSVS